MCNRVITVNSYGYLWTISYSNKKWASILHTFTNDYSRYGYIYLIRDKSESLDTFKIFKAEVENQINKKIKGVRSDRGGEFYGRNDASGEQCHRSFARYLEQSGIVPQYTMPGTPSMNGIVERRNRTLQDMVRSMMAESSLHIR